ncbi:MAG: NADH-quinone oxidoreductase subunit J [Cyanophyceae cyanobacterium]
MNLSEVVQLVSFGVLTLLMLGAALGVVLSPSVVYSAFLLGLTFSSMAGLYLLLNADFVAAAQILVYVGAVNVLILFGVMLVNKRQDYQRETGLLLRQLLTAVVCFGLFALLGTVTVITPWQLAEGVTQVDSSVIALAKHLFSDYLLPFEVASVLLLMAMIGAIVLARRDLLMEDPETGMPAETDLALPERPRETVVGE